MRSAIVHDWLISSVGGGEKVLEAMHRLFPSPIYTLVKDEKALKGSYFEGLEIIQSWIQRFPMAKKKYKSYLPFFPLAIESFRLKDYDVVFSSSHCAAKGVITSPDQVHICYCHTPMRYAWDLMHEYLSESRLDRGVRGFFTKLILHYLRSWDLHSASRVDHFIANSKYVAKRIKKFYRRDAAVIYPGVDVSCFEVEEKKDSFFFTASRLVPYKRIDLIVEAFSKMPDKKLVVIGDGPEMKKILSKAGKNVEILGHQSDLKLKTYLKKAKAFIFAALEDFGILPVEAMASGTPVIAFGKGGALETVSERSGLFFFEQSSEAIFQAVKEFEKKEFSPSFCREEAEKFRLDIFSQKFESFVREKV